MRTGKKRRGICETLVFYHGHVIICILGTNGAVTDTNSLEGGEVEEEDGGGGEGSVLHPTREVERAIERKYLGSSPWEGLPCSVLLLM